MSIYFGRDCALMGRASPTERPSSPEVNARLKVLFVSNLFPNVQDRITWLGTKPDDEIAPFLSAADALCLPSHMEGVPNSAMEAFAYRLPVVGTRVGGIAEITTEQSGILADPRTPSSFAVALATALQRQWNPDTIRQHADRFDWSENARQPRVILRDATI